jgi:hypothetical protein
LFLSPCPKCLDGEVPLAAMPAPGEARRHAQRFKGVMP